MLIELYVARKCIGARAEHNHAVGTAADGAVDLRNSCIRRKRGAHGGAVRDAARNAGGAPVHEPVGGNDGANVRSLCRYRACEHGNAKIEEK